MQCDCPLSLLSDGLDLVLRHLAVVCLKGIFDVAGMFRKRIRNGSIPRRNCVDCVTAKVLKTARVFD